MRSRSAVRLTARCDNACRFCGQYGTGFFEGVDWRAALAAAREGGADEVTFVGGEPLLFEDLVSAIELARSLGYVAVGVQSNGRALVDRGVVDRLRAAGLSDVHLSIHGPTAASHDYHVGRVGAFAEIALAIGHLRAACLPVVVTTVLTRSNFRSLAELAAWLAVHDVDAWCVALPHAAGAAATEFDRVMPRLAVALPFALHALDAACKRGIAVGILGAPACLLGPWIAEQVVGVSRSFAPVCTSCAARPLCAGVDPGYLARFGGDELRARARTDAAPAMSEPLRRMFVGPGELVTVDIAAHESVMAARRRLPVLDRTVPGRDETRRKPESAEALFPALRDDDD